MSAALSLPLGDTQSYPEVWLTQQQVLALTGWTVQWVRKMARGGSIISRQSAEKGRNGKSTPLYLAATLPVDAQKKLAERNARHHKPAPPATLFDVLPTGLSIVRPASVSKPRSLKHDSPEAVLAADRYSKIEPILIYDADPGRWQTLQLADGTHVDSKSRLVRYLSELHQVPERTLWRWSQRSKTETLANRKRSDKGQSRWAVAHPEAAQLAAHVYLGDGTQPGQSVRICHEAVLAQAQLLGLRQQDLPSYETVRSFLATLNPAMTMLARKGRAAYDQTFAPYIQRGYTDVQANEIWVSDHMIHDVYVQNDCFGKRDRGHMRLRFTCLMDFRSRMPVGCAWSEEGSSRSITTALRHAVTTFGPARMLYADNGKDYQKVARGARRDELDQAPAMLADLEALRTQGVFARLGIEVLHCIKFHPQAKHIERMFGTIHARFDKMFPTYCGAAPHLRPDAATAALERHGKLMREGRVHESQLPLASEFIRLAMHWIANEYLHTPQSGKGIDGRTPLQCFEQEPWSQQPAKPTQDVLALLLADRATRRVRECAVEVVGNRYIPADAWSSAQMLSHTTKDVVVAYDSNDADVAVALDTDGHILAYLQKERLLGMYQGSNDPALAEETRTVIAASMQERHRLRRGLVDSRDALARQVRSAGYISKVEQLYQDALPSGVPAAVGDFLAHRPLRAAESTAAPTKQIHSEDIGDKLAARLAARRKHGTQ